MPRQLIGVWAWRLTVPVTKNEVVILEAGERIIPHEGFRPYHAFYSVPGAIPVRLVQLISRGELLRW